MRTRSESLQDVIKVDTDLLTPIQVSNYLSTLASLAFDYKKVVRREYNYFKTLNIYLERLNLVVPDGFFVSKVLLEDFQDILDEERHSKERPSETFYDHKTFIKGIYDRTLRKWSIKNGIDVQVFFATYLNDDDFLLAKILGEHK